MIYFVGIDPAAESFVATVRTAEAEVVCPKRFDNSSEGIAALADWLKEASLRRALKKKPRDSSLLNNLGVSLIGQKRYREASKVLQQVLHINGNFMQARNNYAVALASAGKLGQAETEARKAIRKAPSYIDGVMTLAAILQEEGKMSDLYELLSSSKAAASDPLYKIRLAIAASKTGHCEETIRMLAPLEQNGQIEDPAARDALESCRKSP